VSSQIVVTWLMIVSSVVVHLFGFMQLSSVLQWSSKLQLLMLFVSFLARDAFIRTNCCAIAMMFVYLSVWDGLAL